VDYAAALLEQNRAVDLLLTVMRRVPVADTDIAVFGDTAVWETWLERTPY
jgi:hypothetical protein